MRENYAGRIYDFGKLDQRLDDVQGDEPAVVVAVMRLVGGEEVCFSQYGALCMISLSVIVASLYLLVLVNLT